MQTSISYGDVLYIQYNHSTISNMLLYANGFYDDLIYAGKSEDFSESSFNAGHFIIVPNLLCNTEERAFLSSLTEQLEVLKKGSEAPTNTKEKLLLGNIPESGVAKGVVGLASALLMGVTKSVPKELGEYTTGYEYLNSQFKKKQEIEDKKVERTAKLNECILQNNLGKEVKIGESILLFHYQSQKFLCASSASHKFDNALLGLGLSKQLTQNCYFKFENVVRYGVSSQILAYEEPIAIVTHDGKHIYISQQPLTKPDPDTSIQKGQKLSPNLIPEDEQLSDKWFKHDLVRREFDEKTFTESYHVGITKMDQIGHHYRLSPYLTYAERVEINKTKAIKNGDYVRILMGKYYFTVVQNGYETRTYNEYYDNQNYSHNLTQSIFQVVQLDEKWQNTSKLPLGLPIKVHPAAKAMQQPLERGFILKHLFTGEVIDNITQDRPLKSITPPNTNESLTRVHLYGQTTDTNAFLNRTSMNYVRFTYENKSDFLDRGEPVKFESKEYDTNTRYFIGFQEPADYVADHLKVVRAKPETKKEYSTPARILKVSDEEVYMINESVNFAYHLKIFLLTLIKRINSGQILEAEEVNTITRKCETYLQRLFSKSIADTFSFNVDETNEVAGVNKHLQDYSREARILDICNKILFYLIVKPEINVAVPVDGAAPSKRFENLVDSYIRLIQVLARIILGVTQAHFANHLYNGQYVRLYIWGLFNSAGVYCKFIDALEEMKEMSPKEKTEWQQRYMNVLKDTVLELFKEFLWEHDLQALGQINFYQKNCFTYLENQQDYSSHALQAMRFVFLQKNPGFKHQLRESFIQNLLADENKFKIIFPELIKVQNRPLFCFRRAALPNKQAPEQVEIFAADLRESTPQTMYMRGILEILEAIAPHASFEFILKIVHYYPAEILQQIENIETVYFEIRNTIAAVIENVHSAYKMLPFQNLPQSIKVLCGERRRYEALIADAIKKGGETLIGKFEEEILSEKRFVPPPMKQMASAGIEFLKSFSYADNYDFGRLDNVLNKINSILNDLFEDTLKDLALLYTSVWRILEKTVDEASLDDIGRIAEKAFPMLVLIEHKIIASCVDTVIDEISSRSELSNQSESLASLNFDEDQAKLFHIAVRTAIQDILSDDWKYKVKMYEAVEVPSNLRPFTPENMNRIIGDYLNSELDQGRQKIILAYLEASSQYRQNVLSTINANALFDTAEEAEGLVKLIQMLLEVHRLKREIKILESFGGEDLDKKTLEQIVKAITHVLEEILMIVYDYSEHTKNIFHKDSNEKRRERFIEYIREIKKQEKPQPFVIKREAISIMWQRAMNYLRADGIILPICDLLRNPDIFGEDYGKNPEIMYAIRLTLMLTLVFVYENYENQLLLATHPGFITLMYEQDEQEIELLGIDRDITFIEMLRGNTTLLKMDRKYLIDISVQSFVTQIADRSSKSFEKEGMGIWEVSFVKSLTFLLNAKFQKELFDPYKVVLDNFEYFSKNMKGENLISITKILKEQGGSNYESLTMPVFYYAFEEFLNGIKAFIHLGSLEDINYLQRKIPTKEWINLLTNENLLFQFGPRRDLLQLFDQIFYQKLRRPGIFENKKETYSFLGIILVDLAAFLDFRSKSTKTETNFLEQLKAKLWVIGTPCEKEIRRMSDFYQQIISSYPIDVIQSNTFLDVVPLITVWSECLSNGTLLLLNTLLKEEYKTFANPDHDCIDYILEIFETYVKLTKFDRKTTNEIQKLVLNILSVNEYAHWKKRLAKIAYVDADVQAQDALEVKALIDGKPPTKSLSSIIREEQELLSLEASKEQHRELVSLADTFKDSQMAIEKLVIFLRNDIAENPSLSKESQFAVRMITEIIKAQHTNMEERLKPIYKWFELKPADWVALRELQAFLNEIRLTDLIIQMLETDQKDEVVVSLYDLATCLLYGGNEEVQDRFYEVISGDTENQIAILLRDRLKAKFDYIKSIEEKRMEKLSLESERSIYFYFNNKEDRRLTGLEQKQQIQQKFLDQLQKEDKLTLEVYSSEVLLIFKFLQSLCEGHHFNFQQYLRRQSLEGKPHPQSVGFLEIFKQMYNDYLPFLNSFNIEFGIRLIDLMIETIQGKTRDNAYIFLDDTLVNDLTNTLRVYDGDYDQISRCFVLEEAAQQYSELKEKALVFLLNMIEGSLPDKIEQVRNFFNAPFAIKTLYDTLKRFFSKKGFKFSASNVDNLRRLPDFLSGLTLEENREDIRSALRIYAILKHFWGREPNFEDIILAQAKLSGLSNIEIKELRVFIASFCEEYCVSVEIVTERNPDLIRIYYPKLTICKFLEEMDLMSKFEENVDRSNTQTKIQGLMDESQKMIHAMHAEYKNKQGVKLNVGRMFDIVLFLSNVLTVLICIIVLISFRYDEANGGVEKGNSWQVPLLYTCLSIQVFLAFLQFVAYVLTQSSTIISSHWSQRIEEKTKEEGNDMLREIQNIFRTGTIDEDKIDKQLCDKVLDLKGPVSEEYDILAKQSFYIRFKKTMEEISFVVLDPMFIWQLIFLAICIISEFYVLACAFQTLNLVVRSDTVKRVGLAISRNNKQFLWTLVLLIVIVYIYSIIGFYFMNDTFVSDDERMCEDTLECFLFTLDLGLRSGGGISDAIETGSYTEDQKWQLVVRVLFDLSFFVLIIILLLNVIFGMIIDAFGELRDQKTANENDKKNVCFICGVERSEYERKGNFEEHVTREHNPLNYIYYIAYILEKEKTESVDMTDIESYVSENYKRKENKWIPVGRSLTLDELARAEDEQEEDEEAEQIQAIQKLDNLTDAMEAIAQEIKEMRNSMETGKN